VSTIPRQLDLRVHDLDALNEIELYAEVLSAVAAADRPLTAAELDEALGCGATHLLLDNLTPAEAREWITYIRSAKGAPITVELSGGITLENARAYAETGADFISSGSITHSAPAVDINFGLTLL